MKLLPSLLLLSLLSLPILVSAEEISFRPSAETATDLVDQVLGQSAHRNRERVDLTDRSNRLHLRLIDGTILQDGSIALVDTVTQLTGVLVVPPPQTAADLPVKTFFRSYHYLDAVWDLTGPGAFIGVTNWGGEAAPSPLTATVRADRASNGEPIRVTLTRVDSRGLTIGTSTQNEPPTTIDRISLSLVPPVDFDRASDGIVHGVNVGIFPNERSERAPRTVADRVDLYAPPRQLFLLNNDTRDARITAHQTLGSLNPAPIAGEEDRPRYVAVSPRLIGFMKAFEERLIDNGLDPARVVILRGFVSPTERLRLERAGERIAEFSRHQYGDGIVLVYTDGTNRRMADVNSDGIVDVEDAEVLSQIARNVMNELGTFGAIGVGSNYRGSDGPFLHVDLRGFFTTFSE